MKRTSSLIISAGLFLSISILFTGCLSVTKNYDEVPPMLTALTKKAEVALADGCISNNLRATRECVAKYGAEQLQWFDDNGLEVRFKAIGGKAVVLVCDHGTLIFEDTYCKVKGPDRDYREHNEDMPCEVTMKDVEVKEICSN